MTATLEKITHITPDIRSYETSEFLVSSDLVGVEIEMENILSRIPKLPELKYWRWVEDGSLRNGGIEAIFVQPLSGKDLVLALDEIEALWPTIEIEPEYNERTSLHVHIDVRELTFPQFINFVILASSFERTLFRFAGEHRARNLFCLSLEEAEGDVIKLGRCIKLGNPGDIRHALRDLGKYSSCNMASIFNHGSFEFRHHVGTHDKEQILKWINILLSMKRYAIGLDELPTVASLREISANGIGQYIESVFGAYAKYLMYRDIEHDVINGIRQAQDIIFGSDLANIKPRPQMGYYDPETVFMKYLQEKHPAKFKTYVAKNKKGSKPVLDVEDEMLRILQELGVEVE